MEGCLTQIKHFWGFLRWPRIQELCLHPGRKEISKYQKSVDPRRLTSDIRFGLGSNPYGSRPIDQTMLRCHLPISGDATLLQLDPTRSNRLSLPKLIINNNEVCFDVAFNPHQPDEATKLIQQYATWIQDQVTNINTDLVTYNAQLKNQAAHFVKQKWQNNNRISDALASINLPLRKESTQAPSPIASTYVMKTISDEYYSVGISYAGENTNVAEKLYSFLDENGVNAMIFSRHAKIGETTDHFMFRMVNECERMILLCSKESLNKTGVLNEIDKALGKEARQPGQINIMPIWLDEYVINGWNPPNTYVASEIKRKTGLKLLDHNFKSSETKMKLSKLLEDLRKEPTIPDKSE